MTSDHASCCCNIFYQKYIKQKIKLQINSNERVRVSKWWGESLSNAANCQLAKNNDDGFWTYCCCSCCYCNAAAVWPTKQRKCRSIYVCVCVCRAASPSLTLCVFVYWCVNNSVITGCAVAVAVMSSFSKKGLQSPSAYKRQFAQWDFNTSVLSIAIYP